MNLDDVHAIEELDSLNMLAELRSLPTQLAKAWSSGLQQQPLVLKPVKKIIIAGMGGSAIGADLVASYIQTFCPVPVFVVRDYTLPIWASTKETLVVCSSHSGNTEETLAIFSQAQKADCQLVVITTGGELLKRAKQNSIPTLLFEHFGQPRAAVGFSFGLILSLLFRLGLIADQGEQISDAVSAMNMLINTIDLDCPVANNPAKRIAGQAVGRFVSVFAAEPLAPVARRWKTQINELSKSWAQFENIPEADHNTVAGIFVPENILEKVYAIFLTSTFNHPRNILRLEKTRHVMMLNGLSTDYVTFSEENVMSQMWNAVLFGDFVAYYMAAAYDMDPTPIEAIAYLKKAMQ